MDRHGESDNLDQVMMSLSALNFATLKEIETDIMLEITTIGNNFRAQLVLAKSLEAVRTELMNMERNKDYGRSIEHSRRSAVASHLSGSSAPLAVDKWIDVEIGRWTKEQAERCRHRGRRPSSIDDEDDWS